MTLALKPERFHLLDFTPQPITVCGKTLTADRSGAAYWPAQKALIVADLNLEKGWARADRGRDAAGDTRQTLLRLAEANDRYGPATVVALGDSLYDADAAARVRPENPEILRIMQEDRRWIWITGDAGPVIPARFGGEMLRELVLEGITLRHEPWPARTTHEIAGRMHPAARTVYGTSLRRPCFVSNGLRLVLPAFGAFSGGRNILDDKFGALFGNKGLAVMMLGDDGLYPIAARLLRGD